MPSTAPKPAGRWMAEVVAAWLPGSVLTTGTRVGPPEPGAGPGEVLFSYLDTGRWRSLVRYTTVSGVRVVRLHWSDELEPVGARVVELDVTRLAPS